MFRIEKLRIEQPFAIQCDSLSLNAGTKCALIGASGSGKSTIMKAIAGFVTAASGKIITNRKNVTNMSPSKRPVSMIFQSNNLFMHLSIRQNIALGLRADLKLSKEEWERVKALAEEMRILDCLYRFPREVSGGQAARAALARVVLQARPVVLFDEAFGAVGPAQAEELRALIDKKLFNKARVIIFATHDPSEILNWSDQIAWLGNNRLNEACPSFEFLNNPSEEVLAYFGKTL